MSTLRILEKKMKSQDLISSDTFSLKGIYKKIVLLTKDEF